MDARAFGDFLAAKCNELSKTIENNLLNSAYDKIEMSHRAAGSRDVLKQISEQMESLLADFHKEQQGSDATHGAS